MLIGHKLNLHLWKRAHFLQAVGIFPLNLGVFHLSLMFSHTHCQSLWEQEALKANQDRFPLKTEQIF